MGSGWTDRVNLSRFWRTLRVIKRTEFQGKGGHDHEDEDECEGGWQPVTVVHLWRPISLSCFGRRCRLSSEVEFYGREDTTMKIKTNVKAGPRIYF